MAILKITEYGGLVQTSGGVAPVLQEPPLDTQNITFTTAAQSAEFGPNTRIVKLVCLSDCYIEYGTNPIATADSDYLPAKTIWVTGVNPGQKLSVYDGSS